MVTHISSLVQKIWGIYAHSLPEIRENVACETLSTGYLIKLYLISIHQLHTYEIWVGVEIGKEICIHFRKGARASNTMQV